ISGTGAALRFGLAHSYPRAGPAFKPTLPEENPPPRLRACRYLCIILHISTESMLKAAKSSPDPRLASREERRARIAELVRARHVHSQSELAELLAKAGIAVNQATLSRDLRDMGLLKGRNGYELPTSVPP